MSTAKRAVDQDLIATVKEVMDDDPTLSLRAVATITRTSVGTAYKIARKKLKLFPYKIKIVQELKPDDRPNRKLFADTLLARMEGEPLYLRRVGFTDEATFTVHGHVNRHNCRIWGSENPYVTFEKPRFSPKVQVWCFLHHSRIVGPYFFSDPTVTGANYLEMLENYAYPIIKNIPGLIFQQDGAPPHWALNVRASLDNAFPGSWIGRGGPTAWPARSPDVTPLDFFLWGYVKDRVYKTPVNDMDHLKEKIREAVASVSRTMINQTWKELHSRLVFLSENNGDHVEVYR